MSYEGAWIHSVTCADVTVSRSSAGSAKRYGHAIWDRRSRQGFIDDTRRASSKMSRVFLMIARERDIRLPHSLGRATALIDQVKGGKRGR